jgi:coenzyme Q-binding protein COQ10
MPEFKTTRRVNVPAEIAYRVASDVRLYPRFLPLLTAAKIIGQPQVDGNVSRFKAELSISYAKFNVKESFVSDVTCDASKLTVLSVSTDSPFKEMRTLWSISPAGEHSDVSITINYSMKSLMVQMAVIAAIGVASNKVMSFFERRALEVYRQSATS